MEPMADSSITADHPLLEKFQATLRDYLLRSIAQLKSETEEIDGQIDELNEERLEIGSNLYDLQQKIERQKEEIDNYNNQISDLFESRTKCETENREAEKELKILQENLSNAKRFQSEQLLDLDKLQKVERNIDKWQQEMEHELKVSKLMLGKDKKKKQQICEEKRQMDLLLLNLEMEVRRRELDSNDIMEQIKENEEQISLLNVKLSGTNADLDDLQSDNRRLIASWNEVIHTISNRDKMLAKIDENLKLVNGIRE